MNLTPNSIDIILSCILIIFAILAFLKGFIRDFFSTFNLMIAVIGSYLLSPTISNLFLKNYSSQMVVDLLTRFVVFVVILIIASIISSKISKPLSKKIPSSIDQSLGFGFGFVKGYLILSFLFMIILFFYSNSFGVSSGYSRAELIKQEQIGPYWFRNSRSYDFLSFGANLMQPFIDDIAGQILNDKIAIPNRDLKKNNENLKQFESIERIIKGKKLYEEMLKKLDENQNIKEDEVEKEDTKEEQITEEDTGYSKQEMEKMNRLIEIMSN